MTRFTGIPRAELFRGRRLCVVGNVNRDLRTAPIAAGGYLLRDGETSTAFVRETLGGGGANSAVFAATLGASARFAGKVGDDALGTQLRMKLRRSGVRPYLARDPAQPTGTSINLVYATGRRHFVSCLPSSATLTFADVEPAALRGAEHVLRADVWFSEPMLFGGNEKLLSAAKAGGADTSLDMNWDPFWGDAPGAVVAERKRAVRKVLPLVDLVHGNVRELWWNASGWHAGSPMVKGAWLPAEGSPLSSWVLGQTAHVMYVDGNENIRELWWDSSGWHRQAGGSRGRI